MDLVCLGSEVFMLERALAGNAIHRVVLQHLLELTHKHGDYIDRP